MTVYAIRLGKKDYMETYHLQREIVTRKSKGELEDDFVFFLEHNSVFTLGRRGGKQNLNVPEEFLKNQGIDLIHVERGGDITYHGEGQIVVYPVVSLKHLGFSILEYVSGLEDIMIKSAGDFGVKAKGDTENRGAWINGKKLGSLGVAVKRSVAYHGLALNINLDLKPFEWINPCGLDGVSMTSLQKETGDKIDIESAYDRVMKNTETVFGTAFNIISPETLNDFHSFLFARPASTPS